MLSKETAKKLLEVLDDQIHEMQRIMTDDIKVRNVCIRRLQNCKNEVFNNSELYYEAHGIQEAM
jgi:hypothetical protein